MQAAARRLSVVSATSCARRRLIRDVRLRNKVQRATIDMQDAPTEIPEPVADAMTRLQQVFGQDLEHYLRCRFPAWGWLNPVYWRLRRQRRLPQDIKLILRRQFEQVVAEGESTRKWSRTEASLALEQLLSALPSEEGSEMVGFMSDGSARIVHNWDRDKSWVFYTLQDTPKTQQATEVNPPEQPTPSPSPTHASSYTKELADAIRSTRQDPFNYGRMTQHGKRVADLEWWFYTRIAIILLVIGAAVIVYNYVTR